MFVAAGIDDEDVLGKMVDAVGRHYAQAVRPISPVPLTVDEDGAVVPFTVRGEHRAAAALNQARIALAMNVYGGQAEGMREGEPEDSDTYLAELIAVAVPKGSESTVAAVGHGFAEATLLPQADLIGVLSEDAAELLLVPFGIASPILALTAVDGYDPPRYRLGHGLNADTMADLRRHAIALPAPKP